MCVSDEAAIPLVSVADRAMYKVKKISLEEAANDRAAYVERAIAS